jgi:hypothetical protein
MGNGQPKPSFTSAAYEGSAGDQTGAVVLQEVVQMTGLSEEFLDSEISTLLGAEGQSVTDMTLDQLRSVLMSFLESMNDQMNAEQAPDAVLEMTHHQSKH